MQRPVSATEASADPGAAPHDASTQAPWWRLGLWWVASVLVALLHNGLWATPNLRFMAHIAQNPGTNPFPESLPGDYLLTSLSMPSLASILGQTEPHQVARLHLVVLLIVWAGVVALARHRFGYRVARNLSVLLAASPVVTVSMQWLGQPDPVTAMCGVAMVLVRRRWAVVAFGLLAGLTHPEQAIFMAPVAGAVRALLPPEVSGADAGSTTTPEAPADTSLQWLAGTALSIAAAVGGVVMGRFITQVWFWISDITINVPRSEYIDSGLATFWDHHTQSPGALLWSLWGPLWLVALALVVLGMAGLLREGRPPNARWAVWGMCALSLVALLPVFLTLDETRVYAVLTAPILAGAAVWLPRVLPEDLSVRGAAALLVVTAVIPGIMATGTFSSRGDLDTPAMLSFLANGSVPGGYQDPVEGPLITEWLLEPFDIVLDDPGG